MGGVENYAGFCLAVLVFLALPGPGTFALLSATGQGGFRAGAAATLGLMLGDQLLIALAVAGVAALLAASPLAFQGLQYVGAAYLAWLGVKLLLKRPGTASPVSLKPGHYLRQAFTITVLNPKAIVFYMAFFPLFLRPDAPSPWVATGVLAATIAVITAVYCLTLCALADRVASKVRQHARLATALERLAGVFLIGFGLRLARG